MNLAAQGAETEAKQEFLKHIDPCGKGWGMWHFNRPFEGYLARMFICQCLGAKM
jgi:hypothetical protein